MEMAIIIAAAGCVAVAAVVFTPRFIQAENKEPESVTASVEAHQQFMIMFSELLGRAHEVLAIHHDGPSDIIILLWLEDRVQAGAINERELAVVRYSSVLQRMTISAIEHVDDKEPIRAVDACDVVDRAYCDDFRADVRATHRHIALGVSSVTIRQAGSLPSNRVRLNVDLTWAADSVDGSDKASMMVDVVMRRGCAQE